MGLPLGAGGLAALEGCVDSEGAHPSTQTTTQTASGTQLVWVDTVLGAAPPATRTGDLATKTSTDLGNAIVAIAKGCVTPGDGGGVFYWDAAASGADDGGTVIAPNGIGTGRWIRIFGEAMNVRWFGANGKALGDDQPAIQRAIDAAANGVVYIPPGNYNIGSGTNPNALILHRHFARLTGAGQASILRLKNSNNALITVAPDSVANDGSIVGAQVEDLQLTADIATSFWGVFCAASSNLLIEGVTVTSMGFGFGLEPALPRQIHNAMIRNCTLNSIKQQGIALFNCIDCYISDTNIFMNGFSANSVGLLYSSGCDGLFVSNLIVTQSQTPVAIQNDLNTIPPKDAFFSRSAIDAGVGNPSRLGAVVISNGNRIHFDNCWIATFGIEDTGANDVPGVLIRNEGTQFSPPCDIEISSCEILNNGLDGIQISSGQNIAVIGCHCLGNQRAGVFVTNASHVRVADTRCGPKGPGGGDVFFTPQLGVSIGTGSSHVIVGNCDLMGNTTNLSIAGGLTNVVAVHNLT